MGTAQLKTVPEEKAKSDAPVKCQICGATAKFFARHPQAALYRCDSCSHCFSDLSTVEIEGYKENYFYEDHKRWFENPNTGLFDRIAKTIPQGASVLDAGCGRGDMLRYFRKIRPDLALTGIDLSPNKDSDGIKYYQGDINTMDIGGPFDAVVSLAVIEHVGEVSTFVDRLVQLVKPGGAVVVMTLNDDSLLYDLARLGKCMGVPLAFNRVYSKHHLHHFTRKSLRTVLERHGLKIESELVHNAPMAAIDIPVKNKVAEMVLRAIIWAVFMAGEATGKSFLQTIFCRRPA